MTFLLNMIVKYSQSLFLKCGRVTNFQKYTVGCLIRSEPWLFFLIYAIVGLVKRQTQKCIKLKRKLKKRRSLNGFVWNHSLYAERDADTTAAHLYVDVRCLVWLQSVWGFSDVCWLSRYLLGTALCWCLDSPFSPVRGCCGVDSGHSHSSCAVLSLFSAVYWLLGLLYGRGHWTGALCGRDYSLLWNTNDRLLSQIYFLHLRSTYPFLSLLHHPFLNLFLFHSFCHPKPIILSLLPPSPPAQCQALHTHTRSNAQPPRIQTHTLTLRTALLSPSKLLRSFTHSLTQSYFSMVAFVPFISSKTKDSCARRTEGRSGMESRTGRKRS